MLKKTILNQGQTLIEAIIALTIILVIMSVTTVAVISSLGNANYVTQQTQANKIAQEGMEAIRDQIANNGQFSAYSLITSAYGRCFGPTYIMNPPAPSNGVCSDIYLVDGKFSRVAEFVNAQCGGTTFTDGLKATVTVYWRDSKCSGTTYCHKQEVTSCFINPATIKTLPASQTGI